MKTINLISLTLALFFQLSSYGQTIRNPMYTPESDPGIDMKELHFQLTTERMSENRKFEVIVEPIPRLNTAQQVRYYAAIMFGLEKYKLSKATELKIVENALDAAKQMPYVAHNPNGWTTPLEDLMNSILLWNAPLQGTLGEQSKSVYNKVFSLPGLTDDQLGTIIGSLHYWSNDNNLYPDYETIMIAVIQSPRFTPRLAEVILENIDSKTFWTSKDSSISGTFRAPYDVQTRVLTELIKSNDVTGEFANQARRLRNKFEISAQLEAVINTTQAQPQNWVKAQSEVIRFIETGDHAPRTVDVIGQWFIQSQVPDTVINSVTSALLKRLDSLLGPVDIYQFLEYDSLRSLLNYTTKFSLSEANQKALVDLVLEHTKPTNFKSERLRYLLISKLTYNFDGNKYFPSPITQYAYERFVESYWGSFKQTRENPNAPNGEDSINMILRALEQCQKIDKSTNEYGFYTEVCNTIPEPIKIAQKILANLKINGELRNRAKIIANSN